MKLKLRVVGLGVATALALGIGVGPGVVSSVSANNSVVVSPLSAEAPRVDRVASVSSLSGGTSAVGVQSSTAQGSQWGVVFRAVVEALKKVPGLWDKAVKAVKAGWAAFSKFWTETVPGWIKTLLGGLSVNALYDWLKDLLNL